MQELIDQLLTTAVGLSLLGGTYIVWLMTGVANNAFSPFKWSWKRTAEDIAKTTLMALAIIAWVAVCGGVDWFASQMGADISALLNGASVAGVMGGIIGGTVYFLAKAYNNIINFVNSDHLEVEATSPDYAGVSKALTELTGALFKHDNDVNDMVAVAPELGAACYYKVDVSTPDAFYKAVNGKGFNEGFGFQCVAGFKEFMYSLSGTYVSAGGAAKNYAFSHAAVEALGFKWHSGRSGLQNGDWAVWTDGAYGHVSMRYNGKWFGQNQGAKDGSVGNPFNLMALPEAGIAGYYRPNIYQPKWSTTPAQKPTKKEPTFKVGDNVVPTKLVDYDGTPLRQYDKSYKISQINGDRAVLTAPRNGKPVVWAAMNTANLKKA